VDYAAVTVAPVDGWSNDADAVFGDWYDYDGSTHTLSPKPRVYLLRGRDGVAYRLQIQSYYDASGEVHRPQLRWSPLAGG
jgi:hypothetical protein